MIGRSVACPSTSAAQPTTRLTERRGENVARDAAERHHHARVELDVGVAGRLWPALAGRPATPEQERLLNAVLVVLADHDRAVSTLAAGVAASARANPYAVVSAGLGALDRPQHGAASTLAHRFLAEALADPVAELAERLRTGSPIPGFGHRVYRAGDPRTALVLALLGDGPVRAAVDAVAARLAGRPGGFPNA